MYSPAAVGHINPRAANAMALTLWGSFVGLFGPKLFLRNQVEPRTCEIGLGTWCQVERIL